MMEVGCWGDETKLVMCAHGLCVQ